MVYTVGEMAKRLGVASSTLRYYDREGLLPFVERSGNGVRVFKESDYEWLQVIACLKKTGMALKDIRLFVEMAMEGDETIEERLALISRQKAAVEEKIATLNDTLHTLEFKEWYYTIAKAAGTTAVPRELPLDELPEAFQTVRLRLKGY